MGSSERDCYASHSSCFFARCLLEVQGVSIGVALEAHIPTQRPIHSKDMKPHAQPKAHTAPSNRDTATRSPRKTASARFLEKRPASWKAFFWSHGWQGVGLRV